MRAALLAPLLASSAALLHRLRLRWRADGDFRLAVWGLAGGFLIPFTLIVLVVQLFPPAPEDTLALDASVPAPVAQAFETAPEEDRSAQSWLPEFLRRSDRQTDSQPEKLTPATFRFEGYVQRQEGGKLRLLSEAAERQIKSWYPPGTAAVEVMRFFGTVMQNSYGSSTAEAASQARCLSLPRGKAITTNTVICTYGHPPPTVGHSTTTRVFWLLALSYDHHRKITDLVVHARLTRANR